ncbi:uncharacterized protein SAPINGB_P005358 [Magnusiomyces paraingens]|uniref:Protein kinase domain-containing protein n=1 Tax=Magnusiomyces paraingens TaxID=2606893 RepID=A0A5E8C4I7_9ASCO|nr:uncharacterized protein SAPINGB_P005358 [Saprochaete ingens]VVT56871.1 unnamed protein product [Saprochaete ingens]
MDFLSKAIFKSSSVPYKYSEETRVHGSFADKYPHAWTIYNATSRSDDSPATVFVCDNATVRASSGPSAQVFARHMATKLRTLKLPGIIKFKDFYESPESLTLVTEHVIPLYLYLESHELSDDAIFWGIHTIAKTLALIHNTLSSAHTNIDLGAIYVNDSGEWVLGSFECLASEQEFSQLASAAAKPPGFLGPLFSCLPSISEKDIPRGRTISRRQMLDTAQFADLIAKILADRPRARAAIGAQLLAKLKSTRHLTPSSLDDFLANSPALSDSSQLAQITNALPTLRITDEETILAFLTLLDSAGDKFPHEYLHNQVVPALVDTFNSGRLSASSLHLFSLVIRFSKDMPSTQYKTLVAPLIVKQFAAPDRAVRTSLLQSLPDYIAFMDTRLVSDKVWPSLATGFSDTDPALRELTVRAVFSIASKLSDRILNGDLLRQLAKVQSDSQKEIRANTTILLGKIAPLFSQSTRSAVLVAAFGRALKDPFVQSRLASLRALSACNEYFSIQDTCNKVLGTLAPALVDSDSVVRKEALETFEMYFDKVKEHANELDQKQQQQSGVPTDDSSDQQQQLNQNGGESAAATAGWANWASSLTISVASKAVSAVSSSASSPAPSEDKQQSTTTTTTTTSKSPEPLTSHSSFGQKAVTKTTPSIVRKKLPTTYQPSAADNDAWGSENDDDAWGNGDDDDGDAWGNNDDGNDGNDDNNDTWDSPTTSSTLTSPSRVPPVSRTGPKSPAHNHHGALHLPSHNQVSATHKAPNAFAHAFGTAALQQSTAASRAHSVLAKKQKEKEEEEVEDAWDDF